MLQRFQTGARPRADPEAQCRRRLWHSICTTAAQGYGTRHELPPQRTFHTNRPRVFSRGPATVDLQTLGTHHTGLHGRSVRRKPDGRPAIYEGFV